MGDKEKHYLEELISYLKLNASSFAKSIGYDSPNRIYHVLRFRNGLSRDMARDICSVYSNVNYDWLISGEGSMLKSETTNDNITLPSNDVSISREAWEMIKLQIETINNQQQAILSQQQTIEYLTKKGGTAETA